MSATCAPSYGRPRVAATPARHVAISLAKGRSSSLEEEIRSGYQLEQAVQGSATSLPDSPPAHRPPRRWTRAETQAAVKAAHPFRYPSPTEDQLRDICQGYERITGDPVHRHPVQRFDKKANYIAACWRVHGDDFLPLVQHVYDSIGTTLNLLGTIRSYPPRKPVTPAVEVPMQTPARVVDHKPPSRPPLVDQDIADCFDRFDELDPYGGPIQ